jgi:hypothetical protein
MAELHCEEDIIVSRDQVHRSSQSYGVIERKSSGSTGSGGAHMAEGFVEALLADTNKYPSIIELTFDTSGCEAFDPDRPYQPCGKHGYLPAEKVEEIEQWLAKVDPEGHDGSFGAYCRLAAKRFKLPGESFQESCKEVEN